jgi:hypothetical protein
MLHILVELLDRVLVHILHFLRGSREQIRVSILEELI